MITQYYIAEQVRQGTLELDLMKALDFMWYMFSRNVGELGVELLLRFVPGLLFAYLFLGFRLPPSAQAGLAFLDSLAHCPHCRACLAEHEALQRRIRHSLLADLRKAWPSAGMTFSAIAPSLEHPNSFAGLWQRASQFVPGMTALAALAGLVLAVIGLFEGIGRPAVGLVQMSAAPLPVAACFLFAIPVIGNYYESRIVPSRLILSGVLAFILWVGTAIVGLYEIFLVREQPLTHSLRRNPHSAHQRLNDHARRLRERL